MALTAAVSPAYLADTSALARLRHGRVHARLAPLILAGEVATCGIVDLEVLFSARDAAEIRAMRLDRSRAYSQVAIEQADFDRAIETLVRLAEAGQHRGSSIPDLLLASAAERHRLIVLHYDSDFDRIAAVTRQPTEWVVPRGSVP